MIGKPRKRIRNLQNHKSFIAKQCVERGLERLTKKNRKIIAKKVFKVQSNCKCAGAIKKKLSCPQTIKSERQKQIFEAFYHEMCWSQKTMYIRSCVKREPVKSKKSNTHPLIPLKNRDFNQVYTLTDENGVENQVCRDFFMNCIQVTPTRISGAIKTFEKNPAAVENRGKSSSANKTSDFHHQTVCKFIDRIPKYESHYGRGKSQRMYLHHTLNIKKLYNEYKGNHDPKKGECVSEYIFREIFYTKYNLSFKRRHSDTCRTCDEINNGLKSTLVSEQHKKELEMNHKSHLDLVEKVRSEFVVDVENATNSDNKVIVLTFDLQKTLETPSLTTSVAFYKRQLWTYNLCIYDEGKRQAFMYVWSEDVASRGGQEVGSCLLKHFKTHIPDEATKIILYSDACGGQNRNIKLTLLLKKYLHDLTPDDALMSIQQKYFVSGHSYNSCDRCFGLIERHRKTKAEIYTPNDWINLIIEAKKNSPKFTVYMMQTTDFVSSVDLQSMIVNRKKTSDGFKVNWFKIRSFEYKKDEPFRLYNVCTDGSLRVLDIQKKKINEESLTMCNLPVLFPEGNEISQKKYVDLIELLKYVPAEHHEFFTKLKHQNDKDDYGLASDCSE